MSPGPLLIKSFFAIVLAYASPVSSLRAGETLQTILNSSGRGRRGAAMVSNPMTGELLAVWNEGVATGQAFPPGSTVKIVLAAAALEESLVNPNDRIFCRRVPELLGEAYHCSHPALDEGLNLQQALANSCNYFFVALSQRLSSAALAHWYTVFGFAGAADDVSSRPAAGRVSVGPSAPERARAALGEATVLVTPEQLLLSYSAIATQGEVFSLHSAVVSQNSSPRLRHVKLQPRTFETLAAGLEECVRSGSGQAAAVPGVRVAGKTGTATALDGSRATHAWFVGYAPAERPQIALVIFLERGTGARDAAPLAGKILRRYFAPEHSKP